MDIHFDTEVVKQSGLSIHEYLYLKNLFLPIQERIPDLYQLIDNFDDESLQNRGFLKYTNDGPVLRHKAIDLFAPKELFDTFLAMFPIKAPSGRYLSPKKTDGVIVKKLKEKWIKLFKGKNNLEQKAIQVLDAELKMRREAGSMEYIHNIETWLNQADYEKYEYLLEEDLEETRQFTKDWMQ